MKEKATSSQWAVPIILFGVSLITFGLLAPKLGFYMDDWPYVYYAYTRGLKAVPEMLFYDSRPYAGWLYTLGFKFFGFKPLYWHLSTLFFRWLSALALWLTLGALWKNYKKLAIYSALLFAVYPFFLMQPLALGSTHHWVGFSLYIFSLWVMIRAESASKWRIPLILVSLFLEGVHLFTAEYFSGLELLRPFILWILISRKEKSIPKILWKTALNWLPYLLILGGYFYWRIVLFQGPPAGDRNPPVLLYQFFKEPLSTSFSLLITALKDASIILFGSWFQAINPDVFNLSSIFASFTLFLMFISFITLYILFNHLPLDKKNDRLSKQGRKWRKEGIVLGIVALFSGPLPIWIIGKAIATHANKIAATRFGIPSMLGAAILWAVLVDFFITERKKENMAIALLIVLAMGVHLHNAHKYQYSWEKQKKLYYQLAERIPALDPNTAIISEAEILPFMGEYPTSYAINTFYFPVENLYTEKIPYWFFAGYAGYYNKLDVFTEGAPLEKEHLLSTFQGDTTKSLLIAFEPERQQCLWVLRPEDADLRLISKLERQASLSSAIDRIQIDANAPHPLSEEIFGNDIPKDWCSYYQKADLARQRGDWSKITSLWEKAQKADKTPANGFEYIPFIEGYGHQENWDEVKALTRRANKVSQEMYPILCSTLYRLEDTTPASEEREIILIDLQNYLQCDER